MPEIYDMSYKKCIFRLDQNNKCGVTTRYQSDYCNDHYEMRCHVCNGPATHICFETVFGDCRVPLCSNTFCITKHDLDFKHARTIWEW